MASHCACPAGKMSIHLFHPHSSIALCQGQLAQPQGHVELAIRGEGCLASGIQKTVISIM